MVMEAPTRFSPPWADLPSELLQQIAAADSPLRDYQCLRVVCAPWRSALAPPYPCLLSLAGGGCSASVFSFPMRRSFNLYTASEPLDEGIQEGHTHCPDRSRVRVVGSGNGRLAVAVDHGSLYRGGPDGYLVEWRTVRILLVDPRSRAEYGELPPPPVSGDDYKCVLKVMFTPDTGRGTILATCNRKKVSYLDTGSARGRNMVWTAVDDVDGDSGHLADLAFGAGGGKLYCVDTRGAMRVLGIPHNCQDPAPVANNPAVTRLPAVFPAPYDAVSKLTGTKHLFFCHGNLYQVWQNTSVTIKLSSGFTMSADEIYVLRYDPACWPAWQEVKDLGGRSVFIGKSSNPAVVRSAGAGAVPGVQPDCVYWINWHHVPMVCDVATGASQPFVTPSGVGSGDCWYFDDDNMRNNHGEEREKIVSSPTVAKYNWLTIGVSAKDNWLRIGVGED